MNFQNNLGQTTDMSVINHNTDAFNKDKIKDIDRTDIPRLRQYYLSLDIDLTISPLKEASDAAFNESETV